MNDTEMAGEAMHEHARDFLGRLTDLLTRIRADEREQCARLCDDRAAATRRVYGIGTDDGEQFARIEEDCAAVIRGRGDE